MVFCYKIITETPRRSGSGRASPSSAPPPPPAGRVPLHVPSSLSALVASAEYEAESVVESIPEREWRLLAALARKKEEERSRDHLADQFRRLWEREKRDRDQVEAESGRQYRRFLSEQRERERAWAEARRRAQAAESLGRRACLLAAIRGKESRSRELLASASDRKASELISRALQDEARAALAAERRALDAEAAACRLSLGLAHSAQRAQRARRKRDQTLLDSAKRVAISHALSSWETALARREVSLLDSARRAQHAARAAYAEQRGAALCSARERRVTRARRRAALTQQMRDDLRSGRAPFAAS